MQDGAAPEAAPLTDGDPSTGGSLYVPFRLEPGQSKTIRVRLAWHVPETDLRYGKDLPGARLRALADRATAARQPGATGRGMRAGSPTSRRSTHTGESTTMRSEPRPLAFSDCFYDTTLPAEVVEAVAANLTILKSPTVLRQTDGRLWAWEGCFDSAGCCPGSCTHVWNYAQALPHLFPDLERSLRETEFGPNQDELGHQVFRAAIPIRPVVHDFHAAADGQLGGIMKAHREWRISGDTEWLRRLWPR